MRKKSRYIAAFIILIILLGAALAANVCIGSVSVPVSQVWDILTGEQADEVYRNIVMQIRLPRALGGAAMGGALALSGYLLQTFSIIRLPVRLLWGSLPEPRW